MVSINPYLNFNGNCEEAFLFYQSVFEGELTLHRYADTAETSNLPRNDLNKLMHVSLSIGAGNFLMASDTLDSQGHKLNPGNNFYISVQAENREEADKLFKELSPGGEKRMEMQETFWGSYFGMLKDKFGIQWMIDCDLKDNMQSL
ncbi:VOC family protein [soil metagenome]